MNKKILFSLAILLFSSSLIFAGNDEGNNGNGLGNYPDDDTSSVSVGGGDATTVVVEAADINMSFVLEANTTDVWVDVDDGEVYDSSWDARSPFTVDFRVRATAGSFDDPQGILVEVEVGNLYRDGVKDNTFSNYFDAGIGYLYAASVGAKFIHGTFDLPNGQLPITTKQNHKYGELNNEDKDSLYFTVKYDGDTSAPSGRYESDVLINYSAT